MNSSRENHDPDGGDTSPEVAQPSLFVGSFNINASDLSKEAAVAWLARAADADIVALGLQVPCAPSS